MASEFEVGDICYVDYNGEMYVCEICILAEDGAICVFEDEHIAGNQYGIKAVPYYELMRYEIPQEALGQRRHDIRELYDLRREEAGYESEITDYESESEIDRAFSSNPYERQMDAYDDEPPTSRRKQMDKSTFDAFFFNQMYPTHETIDAIQLREEREQMKQDMMQQELYPEEEEEIHFSSSSGEEVYDFGDFEDFDPSTVPFDDISSATSSYVPINYGQRRGSSDIDSILSNTSSYLTNTSEESNLSELSGFELEQSIKRRIDKFKAEQEKEQVLSPRFQRPTESSSKKKRKSRADQPRTKAGKSAKAPAPASPPKKKKKKGT